MGDAATTWKANGHCYTWHAEPLPWEEARLACRDQNAYLVTIDSDAESTALTALPGDAERFWIGLESSVVRGGFFWISGEPFDPVRSNWTARPEPGGCVAQIGAIQPPNNVRNWGLVPCSEPLPFLCETSRWLVAPSNRHAYRALDQERTWDGARRACARVGAHLVTIAGDDEAAFISVNFSGQFWLGAIRRDAGVFEWEDGTPLDPARFSPGEPNLPTAPSCVVQGDVRRWYDRMCDGSELVPYGVVCEIDR